MRGADGVPLGQPALSLAAKLLSRAERAGLVVTPPDETKSVSLQWPGAATLPVTEGGGSPVRVGPIGSAGQGG